jgi:hypothetical protein
MLANTIRDRLTEVSFVPFVIRLNDGREIPFHHPDFANVSPKGSTLLIYGDDDGSRILPSLLIASIEQIPAKAKSRRKPRG